MQVRLFKSSKYKGDILQPGIHTVTAKKGKEWINLDIAKEIVEDKKDSIKEPIIESPNEDEKVDELKELDIDLDLKE